MAIGLEFTSDIEEIKGGYYSRSKREYIIDLEVENIKYELTWSKDDFESIMGDFVVNKQDISKNEIQEIIEAIVIKKIESIKNELRSNN